VQALLDTIRILGQEIGKQHAVDRFAPMASKRHRIGPWLERWLSDFEQQVKASERAPRTLREYRRWGKSGGHFDYWRNRSIHAVGPLAGREFLKWLRLRNVTGKTAWNVVAGFHAFLGWLVEVEQLAAPRRSPGRRSRGATRPRSGPRPSGRSWMRSQRRSAASSWRWRCSASGRARRWRWPRGSCGATAGSRST
jgi:hypothetical protein